MILRELIGLEFCLYLKLDVTNLAISLMPHLSACLLLQNNM